MVNMAVKSEQALDKTRLSKAQIVEQKSMFRHLSVPLQHRHHSGPIRCFNKIVHADILSFAKRASALITPIYDTQ